jgi:hypothetical protein
MRISGGDRSGPLSDSVLSGLVEFSEAMPLPGYDSYSPPTIPNALRWLNPSGPVATLRPTLPHVFVAAPTDG